MRIEYISYCTQRRKVDIKESSCLEQSGLFSHFPRTSRTLLNAKPRKYIYKKGKKAFEFCNMDLKRKKYLFCRRFLPVLVEVFIVSRRFGSFPIQIFVVERHPMERQQSIMLQCVCHQTIDYRISAFTLDSSGLIGLSCIRRSGIRWAKF